jgi:hypothetical protein
MSFSGIELGEEANVEEELSDDGSQLGEKKRRLNMEQVKTLEKSFELGNKLEPERKMQLARALGLQPRQIAIWFQNRRARWKTKQLEKDYDILKRQYDTIKADNDALQAQNQKLQTEVCVLNFLFIHVFFIFTNRSDKDRIPVYIHDPISCCISMINFDADVRDLFLGTNLLTQLKNVK